MVKKTMRERSEPQRGCIIETRALPKENVLHYCSAKRVTKSSGALRSPPHLVEVPDSDARSRDVNLPKDSNRTLLLSFIEDVKLHILHHSSSWGVLRVA